MSELFRYDTDPMSLDVAVGEDGDTSLGDLVVNRTAESPFEAVASSMLPDEVARFLDRLSDEERQVLELRYGLDRGEPRTQGEVGKRCSSPLSGFAASSGTPSASCAASSPAATPTTCWPANCGF